MGAAIGEVVPLAIAVVLVNPLPIMAVIVMLFSPRAKATASAFVAGWVGGLLLVCWLLLAFTPERLVGSEREPAPFSYVVRVVLGAVLLVLAARQWQGRKAPGGKALPGWMQSLEQMPPWRALAVGALFAGINPKNLPFTITAVVAIAQAELSAGEKAVPVVIYALLASVGVLAPVIWYLVDQESARRTLAQWRAWLTANYSTVMAVVLFLFGVILVSKGLGGLLA